jgi:hypothetical protein
MPPVTKAKPKQPAYVVKLEIGASTTTQLHHHDGENTVGDVEVFEADFFDAKGNLYSSEGGIWTLVRLPNVWHAVVIHKWPKGDLAVHLLQDFDDPNKPYRFAITGGTGDYQGAYGQVEYVSEQDITFRFSTP